MSYLLSINKSEGDTELTLYFNAHRGLFEVMDVLTLESDPSKHYVSIEHKITGQRSMVPGDSMWASQFDNDSSRRITNLKRHDKIRTPNRYTVVHDDDYVHLGFEDFHKAQLNSMGRLTIYEMSDGNSIEYNGRYHMNNVLVSSIYDAVANFIPAYTLDPIVLVINRDGEILFITDNIDNIRTSRDYIDIFERTGNKFNIRHENMAILTNVRLGPITRLGLWSHEIHSIVTNTRGAEARYSKFINGYNFY